jgi:exonuclease SbcD
MKLLHTSDLHLGGSWDGQNRRADNKRVLGEVIELCDHHAADLLLITGDIFSDRPRGTLAAVARDFLQQLKQPMQRGLRVVLLRGNHDNLAFFELLHQLLDDVIGPGSAALTVAATPSVYNVPRSDLQIVALPYITPSMLDREAPDASVGADERIVNLAGKLAQYVNKLYTRVDSARPSIFAGHITVSGARISEEQEFEAGYARELVLAPDRLPHFTSYNALGHIHYSQEIRTAAKPTWYAGGFDRHDRGERDYTPQVLLVELPARPGGTAQVTPIPLSRCTPFVEATCATCEEVSRLCERIDGTDPLGRITLSVPYADRAQCEGQLLAAAPRVRLVFEGVEPALVIADEEINPRDVPATVYHYLETTYANEARRERLRQAFDQLWQEAEG